MPAETKLYSADTQEAYFFHFTKMHFSQHFGTLTEPTRKTLTLH